MQPSNNFRLNDKRIIRGWAFYDWANSAFALVITVAVFPDYFLSITPASVQFWGITVPNSGLISFSIAAAYIIVAIISPLLAGIADYGGKRKVFLSICTVIGSAACLSLFFFREDQVNNWILGSSAFIIANIGFAASLVFYNAYLPDIATDDRLDRVSALGFAYGYVGSVLLLIANLVVITYNEALGLTTLEAVRTAFLTVGLWWFGFAQITLRRLPEIAPKGTSQDLITKGYREINTVFKSVLKQGNIKRFLFAFFFYSAGVQTVLYLASTFAKKELSFESTDLIVLVLLLQIIAIGGAYFFARISEMIGNKRTIIYMLLIWIVICALAYTVTAKLTFYFIAALVGLVMGGIQSLSRSTYSKIIPDDSPDTTSYFSFYDVIEKIAIVLGTFSFGFIETVTGGMRNSILVLTAYFFIGMIILFSVQVQHAIPIRQLRK